MNIEKLHQLFLANRIICTDSRQIKPGCIFFALKGDRFDGNAYAEKALADGAALAVVDDLKLTPNNHFWVVADALSALQELALFHRKTFTIPFIAITGTNGKTTTKELLHSVLSQHCKTHATKGNLNNHIGVPLTILAIPEGTDIAIIEMGANHQGEIAKLCLIACPTHGLITNIGKAHLEGFGGFEGVKKAKGELYDYLADKDATAFLNRDNFLLQDMSREKNVQKKVTYGSSADNFISGALHSAMPFLQVAWHREGMESDDRTHLSKSNLSGVYNLENILAAICIATYFKLSPAQISAGIESYHPKNNRSQITRTADNMLICDFYNANPSSMAVALENLHQSDHPAKAFILADMFELGADAAAEHLEILNRALDLNVDRGIFIGEEFFKLKQHAQNPFEFYKTTQNAYDALKAAPISAKLILIKGSRGMKLEDLLELF